MFIIYIVIWLCSSKLLTWTYSQAVIGPTPSKFFAHIVHPDGIERIFARRLRPWSRVQLGVDKTNAKKKRGNLNENNNGEQCGISDDERYCDYENQNGVDCMRRMNTRDIGS